jgi:hypothetical protein
MLSRLIIWILLVLLPLQSFAAIGLIQCPADGERAGQVHHSHVSQTTGRGVIASAAMQTSTHVEHSVSHVDVHKLTDAGHHHSHKLPCCSDGAIIFSPNVPLSLKSELFTAAADLDPVGLTSVFLEGPKRPPRLTLS